MTDIVEQLRKLAHSDDDTLVCYSCEFDEAADEIEQLRAALEAIANCESHVDGDIVSIARQALNQSSRQEKT